IALIGYDGSTCSHDVDALAIRTTRESTALCDVIVPRQRGIEQMRGRVLDLSEYSHFLLESRNDQLVSVANRNVRSRTRLALNGCVHVDDQSSHRFRSTQLREELLSNGEG